MYRYTFLMRVVALGFVVIFHVAVVNAAANVELVLVGDRQGGALAFQEWAQLLGQAGIRNVQLRTDTGADKIGVENRGSDRDPSYVVTGVVVSRDELKLPGGRYRRSDVERLKQWLDDLASQGPVEKRPKKAAFGLTAPQLDRAMADLVPPVGFSTSGLTAREVVEKIAERLQGPLKWDPDLASALADGKVEDDLTHLSRGTAMAYVLGWVGWGFSPEAAGDGVAYRAVKMPGGGETWPVGRTDVKSPQELLPGLYEFQNVNVQNVPITTVFDAMAKRLKAPVLLDRAALARHEIDPAKTSVSLPKSKTTYSLALRKLLFQAGMKFEVRTDDTETPLLWITSLKP